jgi:hypothetical protein
MYKGLKVGQPMEKKKRKEVEVGLKVGQPMGRKKKKGRLRLRWALRDRSST